jgi:hypothetical protein
MGRIGVMLVAGAVVLAAAIALLVARPRPADKTAPPVDATGEELHALNGTVVVFASVPQAQAVLAAEDDWTAATSEIERAALMERAPPAPPAAFRHWQADNVRAWTAAQRRRWSAALAQIAPRINALQVPLPPRVLLVSTTGHESANTPHTRGAAIVLPQQIDLQGFSDAQLLAHELFHIVSRHDPALQTRLYREIGFEPVGELQWPAAWAPLRIADQDAPHCRHAMQARVAGRPAWLMPVVVAVKDQPDRSKGETLEHLMQLRLLEVRPGLHGEPTEAVMQGGAPVWHAVQDVPDYLDRLGGNTDYVLHPEETLADNFMWLVSARPVPNPGLLRRLEGALKEAAAASTPKARD